jgi:hypothetical protein
MDGLPERPAARRWSGAAHRPQLLGKSLPGRWLHTVAIARFFGSIETGRCLKRLTAGFAWRQPSASGSTGSAAYRPSATAAGITGAPTMDDINDLATLDPLQIDRGDPEVRMAELALDHIQGHALARHLDGVGMAERCGAKRRHCCVVGHVAELRPCCCGRPGSASRGPVDHAEECADRELRSEPQPGI